jgi:RNA polymerase sigma factor (sigma-70 family)
LLLHPYPLLKLLKTYTEAELVTLLQLRSEEGFSYLYDHYSGAISGIIFSIINDLNASEDVLQDVFVRIYRKVEQYDAEKSRLYTWMAQIARNAAIDWKRKTVNQPGSINQKSLEDLSVAVTSINTDVADVRTWIIKLAKPEQDVLVLAYLEGYTQEEIGQILQIPLGTVKSRIRSGLLKLRTLMTDRA